MIADHRWSSQATGDHRWSKHLAWSLQQRGSRCVPPAACCVHFDQNSIEPECAGCRSKQWSPWRRAKHRQVCWHSSLVQTAHWGTHLASVFIFMQREDVAAHSWFYIQTGPHARWLLSWCAADICWTGVVSHLIIVLITALNVYTAIQTVSLSSYNSWILKSFYFSSYYLLHPPYLIYEKENWAFSVSILTYAALVRPLPELHPTGSIALMNCLFVHFSF